MIRSLTAVSCLLFVAATAHAQIHQDWVRTYDAAPSGTDVPYGVEIAPSGNVYVVGRTGDLSALVLKYAPSGNLAWVRTFSPGTPVVGYTTGYSAAIDATNEDVYVFGRVDAAGSSTSGLVLKYDSAGTLLWSRTYPFFGGTFAFEVGDVTSTGDLVLAGTASNGNLIAVKYDHNGAKLWETTILGGEYPNDLSIGAQGEIVIVGSFDEVNTNTKFGVAKLSPTGSLVWRRTANVGGVGSEHANKVVIDRSGSIYVAGRLIDAGGGPNGALVKFDAAGTLLWTRVNHGTEVNPLVQGESFEELVLASDGNLRVGGTTSNTGNERDLCVAEYSTSGQLLWKDTWNGAGSNLDVFLALRAEADASVTVLARTRDLAGIDNPVLVRWDSAGALRWAKVDPISATTPNFLYYGEFGPDGTSVLIGKTTATSVSDAIVVQERNQATSFCFGDHSGTNCPCNAGAPGHGCPNSQNAQGALLFADGDASLSNDSLVLRGTGMANGNALYFQGTSAIQSGVAFGDGLSCVGGSFLRLGSKSNSAGASQYPTIGDPAVSLQGLIGAPGSRAYQVLYRNNANFCTASTFNLSNGLKVDWNL